MKTITQGDFRHGSDLIACLTEEPLNVPCTLVMELDIIGTTESEKKYLNIRRGKKLDSWANLSDVLQELVKPFTQVDFKMRYVCKGCEKLLVRTYRVLLYELNFNLFDNWCYYQCDRIINSLAMHSCQKDARYADFVFFIRTLKESKQKYHEWRWSNSKDNFIQAYSIAVRTYNSFCGTIDFLCEDSEDIEFAVYAKLLLAFLEALSIFVIKYYQDFKFKVNEG